MSKQPIQVEFDRKHIPILVSALEVYSRLQSGQIGIALDTVYSDRNLSWNERNYLENVVRYVAFPPIPKREYDGHGGFYDQYNNEYNKDGEIINESEEWERLRNRPHLDNSNCYFGVGCEEMKKGTIAWEIKKAIEEFLHYERNGGCRTMTVDGDGVLNITGIPNAKIIDPVLKTYWKPEKQFRIPQKYQNKVDSCIKNKNYKEIWNIVDKAFKSKPLPKGSSSRIEEVSGTYYVIVEKPYILG